MTRVRRTLANAAEQSALRLAGDNQCKLLLMSTNAELICLKYNLLVQLSLPKTRSAQIQAGSSDSWYFLCEEMHHSLQSELRSSSGCESRM